MTRPPAAPRTTATRTARLRMSAAVGLIGLGILTIAFDILTWWIGLAWILIGALQLWEARRVAGRVRRTPAPPDPDA